ncbi:MAG: hypothetical protein ACLGHY_02350 [Gammaproteobacteria bacterium]
MPARGLDAIPANALKEGARSHSPAATGRAPPTPLVVDLDNTLLRTDLLAEMLPGYLVRHPSACPGSSAGCWPAGHA